MIGQMKEKLGNVSLEEKLIPKFKVGCRRFTPGVGYLEALSKENVEVVHGGIDRITEKGCVTESGKEYELDVLICATGFNVSFRPRFPIVGLDGRNLQDEWKDEPKAYFGMAAAGFPNYLMFIGPNSPIGNGMLTFHPLFPCPLSISAIPTPQEHAANNNNQDLCYQALVCFPYIPNIYIFSDSSRFRFVYNRLMQLTN